MSESSTSHTQDALLRSILSAAPLRAGLRGVKSKLAVLMALNRKHEQLVIRLSKRVAKLEAELKRLKVRQDKHGRN